MKEWRRGDSFCRCLGGRQARRVDSVEGGSFMFWEVFFSARGASLKGGLGACPPHEILQI